MSFRPLLDDGRVPVMGGFIERIKQALRRRSDAAAQISLAAIVGAGPQRAAN